MRRLKSYLAGSFTEGSGALAPLVNPATEETIAELAGSADMSAAVAHAREHGGPALRELSFRQRGQLLKTMAKCIYNHREELIALSVLNGGNTRGDAKFDVDGASGTLGFYAELSESLGDARALLDGEGMALARSPRFFGQHVWVARQGVAVHINAFNFPAWGPAEKAACAILAGMPIITKPATATALLTHRMVELFVEEKILPEGAFQLLLGPVGSLFDHLTGQDVVAFTGGSDTGVRLRGDPRLLRAGVRVNIEADSLNAAALGPDAEAGSPTYDLCLADVARDMTQKAGQKCTAIRRILVPEGVASRFAQDLADRLSAVKVGNPALEEVTMGPLSTASQRDDVLAGIGKLAGESETILGGRGEAAPLGVPPGKGYFVGPVLFRHPRPEAASAPHALEVFGPVATLLPYDGNARTATSLVRKGGGGLVCSVYSDDRAFLAECVRGVAPLHGRVYVGSEKIADKATGPGTVLPMLVHGGPGRAGAGEELGGTRGMTFSMQRVALQGDKPIIEAILERL